MPVEASRSNQFERGVKSVPACVESISPSVSIRLRKARARLSIIGSDRWLAAAAANSDRSSGVDLKQLKL